MTTPVQVRVDTDVKENVNLLFKSLGLDMSSAINIFFHQCLVKGGLPFEVYNPKYNKLTEESIKEAKRNSGNKKVKAYSSIKDLKEALDK